MNNRAVSLDIIRIIAGISVIFLHVTDPFLTYPPFTGIGGSSWWILNFLSVLCRTAVPLFVVISGILLLDTTKKLDYKSFYTRRFSKIGIPALFWIVFYLCLFVYVGQITNVSAFFRHLLTLNIAHLYFLILILELYLITPLLHTFLRTSSEKSGKFLLLGSFIFTTIVITTNYFFPIGQVNLSQNIATVFLPFVFYYLVGRYIKDVKLSASSLLSLIIVYLYAAVFIAIISQGNVTAYSRKFEGLPIMVMTIISFLILSQTNFVKILKRPAISKIFAYISSLVFGAYLVHIGIIYLLDWQKVFLPENIANPMWVFALVKVGIVLSASFAIAAGAKKVPGLKVLFG